MKIEKDPIIDVLNDILSHIQREKMEAMKDGLQDALEAYDGMFNFVTDIYCEKVTKWERRHPISAMIINIKRKRRLKRFREFTAEIRGTLR